jgi:hypothetical protein
LPVAALAAFLGLTGAALAGTTSISGSVPNGGCGVDHAVPVSGPSRIEVTVSSTSADNSSIFGVIVAPNGAVVANGSYDTPGGGGYAVRVCSQFAGIDSPSMQYTGLVGTGPAGQPALPQHAGAVLGITATIGSSAKGSGAVATRAGLAWFKVNVGTNGAVSLRIFDPVHHQRMVLAKGMHAVIAANTVRITGHGLKLVLVDKGTSQRVTLSSPRLKVSGNVVRGGFQISV